jgi:hypothetical protein
MTLIDRLSAKAKRAAINASASGANTVVAGVPGMVIIALQFLVISTTQFNVTWQASGGTLLTGPLPVAANGGACAPYSPVGWLETPIGEGLSLFLGSANQVGGEVVYVVLDPVWLP